MLPKTTIEARNSPARLLIIPEIPPTDKRESYITSSAYLNQPRSGDVLLAPGVSPG